MLERDFVVVEQDAISLFVVSEAKASKRGRERSLSEWRSWPSIGGRHMSPPFGDWRSGSLQSGQAAGLCDRNELLEEQMARALAILLSGATFALELEVEEAQSAVLPQVAPQVVRPVAQVEDQGELELVAR